MGKQVSPGGRGSHDRGPALGFGPEKDGCRLAGRIWIQHGGDTFLAWGRIVLLERIRELGSINAAAKSMGMGFRHAWLLVDEMNNSCPMPLVTRSTGGKGGGGTRLTPEGEKAVESFWSLVDSFNKWLAQQDPILWETAGRDQGKPGSRSGLKSAASPAHAKVPPARKEKPAPGKPAATGKKGGSERARADGSKKGRSRKADPGWSFP